MSTIHVILIPSSWQHDNLCVDATASVYNIETPTIIIGFHCKVRICANREKWNESQRSDYFMKFRWTHNMNERVIKCLVSRIIWWIQEYLNERFASYFRLHLYVEIGLSLNGKVFHIFELAFWSCSVRRCVLLSEIKENRWTGNDET